MLTKTYDRRMLGDKVVDDEAEMIAKIMDMSEEKIRAYMFALGLDPEEELKRFDEMVARLRQQLKAKGRC